MGVCMLRLAVTESEFIVLEGTSCGQSPSGLDTTLSQV